VLINALVYGEAKWRLGRTAKVYSTRSRCPSAGVPRRRIGGARAIFYFIVLNRDREKNRPDGSKSEKSVIVCRVGGVSIISSRPVYAGKGIKQRFVGRSDNAFNSFVPTVRTTKLFCWLKKHSTNWMFWNALSVYTLNFWNNAFQPGFTRIIQHFHAFNDRASVFYVFLRVFPKQ